MSKCIFTINIDGKERTFNSDFELDSFLKSQYADKNVTVKLDRTFSTTPQAATLNNLNFAKLEYKESAVENIRINEDGDSEVILKIPNSISVTRAITEFGDPTDLSKHIITPFNIKAWREKRIKEWLATGLSESTAKDLVLQEETSWKQLTNYGTEIHNLAQAVIEGRESNFKSSLLDTEQQERFISEFKAFIADIKRRYGNEAKIFTELAIKSRELNENYRKGNRRLIDGAGNVVEDKNPINSINGRIDMLVIDENGIAHIYDFKVSRKGVGDWDMMRNDINKENNTWHSTKKLSASYQMTFYKMILAQYGIKTADINVVPIQLDLSYDTKGLTVENLNEIIFDPTKIVKNPRGTEPGGKIYENVKKIVPVRLNEDTNVDIIEKIAKPFNKLFPDVTLSRKVQTTNSTYEYYRHKSGIVKRIANNSTESEKGKYKFWDKYNRKVYYAKDEKELEKELLEFINRINERKSGELDTLAGRIEAAINGDIPISELSADKSSKKDLYLEKHFKQYIDQKWLFRKNSILNNLGIFVFEKEGVTEIVNITNNELSTRLKLAKGTSILGTFAPDIGIDPKAIMSATNGNIELMKVMMYLNEFADLFSGTRINKIKVLNIWTQEDGYEDYNETLLDNFTRLCDYAHIPVKLKSDIFFTTLESTLFDVQNLNREEDWMRMIDWDISLTENDLEYKKDWLLSRIQELRRKYPKLANETNPNFNDPIWVSYNLLLRALNYLSGFKYYIEPDPNKWIGFGNGPSLGIDITSPNYAESKNIREVSQIISLRNEELRKENVKWDKTIRPILQKFYKAHHQITSAAVGYNIFENLFEKDPDGKISKEFSLKNPDTLTGADKEFVTKFLEVINDLKFNGDSTAIEEAKLSGEYYQVPLVIGSTRSQLKQGGVKQVLKTTWEESTNWTKIFKDQSEEKQRSERENLGVYNRFKIDQPTRSKIINHEGVEMMEINLETIFREYTHTYASEKIASKYIPLIEGFKMGMLYREFFYGQTVTNLIEYIKQYTKINIYNEPIMDPGLLPVYRFMSVLKQATSMTVLGGNFRSGAKELLQGTWIGLSRAAIGVYGKDQFSFKEYSKALGIVLKEAPKSIDKVTLLEYMNWIYGMANADADQLKEEMNITQSGIFSMTSRQLYAFSRAPDMLHRMSILVAKMIHDGCFDAHSVVNDELIYDFKKDKRFSLLSDPNANKNTEEYRKQRGLYTTMLEMFNQEGYNLKDGDALPKAYTNREATSIKSFSDLCYGHYDKNTQLLCKNMFLGSFFFQFKTFISAKLEQWILKPDIYDQGSIQQRVDENGNKYVRKYVPDENGVVKVIITTEDKLEPGDNWEYYTEWKGKFQEGILYTMISYIKAFRKLSPKEFRDLWNNETKRANLFLFIHDMGIMLLLGWLIKMIFSTKEMDESTPWIKRTIASILYGSFQDGPVQNIIGSMLGDLNPPIYTTIKSMFNNVGEVLTGDRELWVGVTENFGALRGLGTSTSIF